MDSIHVQANGFGWLFCGPTDKVNAVDDTNGVYKYTCIRVMVFYSLHPYAHKIIIPSCLIFIAV